MPMRMPHTIYLVVLNTVLHLPTLTAQNSTCHVYNDNGGKVNITEAQTSVQTVVANRFLDLYCKSENFCQIHWLRNGIPQYGSEFMWDFPSDVQQGFMSIKDNNQTLEFVKIYCDAQSEWTCVVSGEEGSLNHTVEVVVTGVPYEGAPLFFSEDSGKLCQNTSSKFGEEVALYCPCTAGDATGDVDIQWYKWVETTDAFKEEEEDGENTDGRWVPISQLGANGTTYTLLPPELEMYYYCDNSEKHSTIGQYLKINTLSEEELGLYRVVATRTDDSDYKGLSASQELHVSKFIPVKPVADTTIAVVIGTFAVGCILVIAVVGLVWKRKGVDIKLMIKDRYGKLESGDGKTIDAYIAYNSESDADLNFVLSTLMPELQKAGYIPFIQDIDAIPGETLVEQLISSLKNSRRCILVISPDFLKARHVALQLEVATDQMLLHQSKIIPLIFKSVKHEDLRNVRGLRRILSVLKDLKWDDTREDKKDRLLKELLLRMPPVNPDRRPASELPLSSQLLAANQSQHSSQQSLVPQDPLASPAIVRVQLPPEQAPGHPHASCA